MSTNNLYLGYLSCKSANKNGFVFAVFMYNVAMNMATCTLSPAAVHLIITASAYNSSLDMRPIMIPELLIHEQNLFYSACSGIM